MIDASDLARFAGQVVRLSGTYQASFAPAHKSLSRDAQGHGVAAGCVVLLALEGGVFVDLFDRPAEEGKRLDKSQVLVTGTLSAPLPEDDDAQAAAAPMDLFEMIHITSIDPAA